jgi:hypothetical protein
VLEAAAPILHAALGLLLAAVVWLAGAGALALLRRDVRSPRSLLDAYPLGLLAVTVAAVLPLLWSALGVLSALLVLTLAGAAVGAVRPLMRFGPLAGSLPACLAFGAGLGALLHGPTDEADSAAYGGMLFYVDKVVSATQSIVPFRDLLAEGERIIYAEAGTSFVGGSLAWLPGFDPVLFNAAALPTFALASLAIGMALFLADRTRSVAGTAVAAALLLGVAILLYPTWLTETPPAAFALPLVFAIWRVWREVHEPRWLALLSGVVAVDLFLTKVVAALALGLLLVCGLVGRGRTRPDFRRLLAIGGALLALGGAAIVALLFVAASWYAGLYEPKALPVDAVRALIDGTIEARSLGLSLLVVGEVVLALGLLRGRSYPLLAAYVPTVLLSWFIAGYGFDVALLLEIFLVGLALLAQDGDRTDVRLALAGGALLAGAAALRDPTGVQPGVVLTLLALLALGTVIVPADALRWMIPALVSGVLLAFADLPALGLLLPAAVAVIAAVGGQTRMLRVATAGACVLALAVAVGRADGLDVGDPATTLTPSDYDIWKFVHDRVGDDALVFTTMTGVEVTPHRGWNNYPSIAGRQLYIAGWYDGRLVSHSEDRDRRLALNRAVLSGRIPPRAAELSRTYGRYFAVARNAERMPASFRRLYVNDAFSLYEIP